MGMCSPALPRLRCTCASIRQANRDQCTALRRVRRPYMKEVRWVAGVQHGHKFTLFASTAPWSGTVKSLQAKGSAGCVDIEQTGAAPPGCVSATAVAAAFVARTVRALGQAQAAAAWERFWRHLRFQGEDWAKGRRGEGSEEWTGRAAADASITCSLARVARAMPCRALPCPA